MNKSLLLLPLMGMSIAAAADATDKPRDWTNTIQDALTVYKSDTTFVQKVKLAWMEQFQVADIQPNGSNGLHLKKGASPVNEEFRRSWVGVNVDFSTGTKFHTWGRIGGLPYRKSYSNGRDIKNYSYTDLFDIWVSQDIKAVKGLTVKAGKIKPLITTDYSTPSSAIWCVERSVVGNQFGLDSNWGLDVTYAPNKQDKVYVQLMANDRASTDKNMGHKDIYRDGRGAKGEFGWEDKCFGIVGASHKFHVNENGYQAVSAQYGHDFNNVYHHTRKKGANCYGFNTQDIISMGYEYKHGKFHGLANLVSAFETNAGDGANNIGIQLQPMYTICPHADLVLRYTGVTGHNSCKLSADRYVYTQNTATISNKGWVDSINTFYVGVDLYASAINKNAAKIMMGAEYLTARKGGSDCYNGWEYTTAFRWNF
ncbi:MAG: hypothetical protein MJ051_06700 [Akkermansia sp.]|nr:hypothetical protein [Akkermansia sp.]